MKRRSPSGKGGAQRRIDVQRARAKRIREEKRTTGGAISSGAREGAHRRSSDGSSGSSRSGGGADAELGGNDAYASKFEMNDELDLDLLSDDGYDGYDDDDDAYEADEEEGGGGLS